jgi:hypothetical protein
MRISIYHSSLIPVYFSSVQVLNIAAPRFRTPVISMRVRDEVMIFWNRALIYGAEEET